MKILFLTDNFPPETNAPATRTYEHCKEWVKQGAEVTVITGVPNFPHGKVFPGYTNKWRQTEWVDGIKVIRVWTFIVANKGKWLRILDYVSYMKMAIIQGLFVKTDIIVATSPQFFTAVAGFVLGTLKRKPWIFELRDLWPDSITATGAMRQGFLLRTLSKLELFLYRKSALIIANSPAFKTDLLHRNIPAEKIYIIPNGCDVESFSKQEKDLELLMKLKLNDKFIVGYIGTHGMAHGLEFILETAKTITDSSIHFLFVGDGAQKEHLLLLREKLNLTNVTFHPSIKRDDLPACLSVLDVALVPLKKADTFKTVIPSKIFEAAVMGKPILLGVEGQAKEIVETYGAGLCFEPENAIEFVAHIMTLKQETRLYTQLQAGCDKLAVAYNRKDLAIKMLNILKDCVNEAR